MSESQGESSMTTTALPAAGSSTPTPAHPVSSSSSSSSSSWFGNMSGGGIQATVKEKLRVNALLPSEYQMSAKWDQCLQSFLVNFSTGLVAGGLSSFVLASSKSTRAAIAGFGAGVGTGASWTTCRLLFEKNEQEGKEAFASAAVEKQ